MYFKRPSFRRGGPTGIGQLTPRRQGYAGGGNIGGGGIGGRNLGTRTGFNIILNEFGLPYEKPPSTYKPNFNLRGGSYVPKSNLPMVIPEKKIPTGGLTKGSRGARLLTQLRGLSVPSFSTTGIMAAPFAIPAYLAYQNRPRTLAEKKVMQDYGVLDETFGLAEDYNKVMKDRLDARKVGDEISFTDALLMDTETGLYPTMFGRTEDRNKRAEIEKAKQEVEDSINMDMRGDPAQFSGEDELTDFDAIAEQIIPNKKIDDDTPKEPTFEDTYEKEKSRIEKLIGDDDQKGMAAIALSEAIGTPGTIADKAAVLNKSLLGIMVGKKKDKKDIAKLAYTATKEIEKAKIMADKEGYSEKLANEVRKYKSVLANPTASEKAKAGARKELEILQGTIETLNPNKAVKVMKPSEARANLKDFEKKAIKLATADKTAADYQTDLASYLADIELLTQYPELYASIIRIDAANVNALGQKDGGRIGFANGTPMEESIQVSETVGQGQVPTAQTPQLSFEEIRNRLPKEITDDVVRLIAGSNEALQDFSYIRTQGDVDKFNMKYGVTLVLPQSTA